MSADAAKKKFSVLVMMSFTTLAHSSDEAEGLVKAEVEILDDPDSSVHFDHITGVRTYWQEDL